jgi:hypothetical protein
MLVAGILIAAPPAWADRASEGPVRASRSGADYLLDNGLVVVRFNSHSGMLSATAGGRALLCEERLGQHSREVTMIEAAGPLGHGEAIEVRRADGSRDRIALYPGVPFVCIQRRLANPGAEVQLVDKTTPTSVQVDLGKPPSDLRLLGCDGLTAGDQERASYAFLAAADPAAGAGVVAGWLTHNRASGIVLSRPDGNRLRIEGRSEFGRLRLAPGGWAEGETFAIGRFADSLRGLEAFADAIARVNQVRLPPAPSGYCTWYSRPHGRAADEQHLGELARFASQTLAPFGFQVAQIDDGWQVSRRDFTGHKPDGPYPAGMLRMASDLRQRALTAGIWLIPFGWDPTRPIFAEHPDWFVKRADGVPYEVTWAGTCLDMTHPGAQEFLRQTVARITGEWGYRYLKLDGLWTGLAARILYPDPRYRDDGLGDAVFHDPERTNLEAYRGGLKVVREAAGDGTFLLGCNIAQNLRTLGASYGLVDAMRVGRDIDARWDHILPCMRMGSRLYFLNGRVWHNDPDCLMLRDPLTLDQARAWASWIVLSGQLNMVSEWLPGLPPDRLEILKRSIPNTGRCGRPVDLFEQADPRIWHLSGGGVGSSHDVVGLFNWDDGHPQVVSLGLAQLDLPGGGKGAYVGFDYWANEFVRPFKEKLEATLPPASCRVIALRPALDRPQVVSTSRHVSQGIVDLLEERWDGASRTLSGTSRVVGMDPYELRIAAPEAGDWRVTAVVLSSGDRDAGVTIRTVQPGPQARVSIHSPVNREVRWQVRFIEGRADSS